MFSSSSLPQSYSGAVPAEDNREQNSAGDELIEGRDFYREGPYMVFTADYLLRRGYCCRSGCRHCPYGFRQESEGQSAADEPV